MQTLINIGTNWLYLDTSCLNGVSDGDDLKIRLDRKNCDTHFADAKASICDRRVGLFFEIKKCISPKGLYNVTVLNSSKEVLHELLVQISE